MCLSKRTDNINSKKSIKRIFSYETKASILFIPINRMCLWCPIMKRKEIIMWIYVYPNRKTNFNSKKWKEGKLFLWNQNINLFIPMRRIKLWCPIIKRKEIIICILVYPNWKMNFNSKINRNTSFSYEMKASISFIPMERICSQFLIMKAKEIITWIRVLSSLVDKLWFKKMVESEVFLMKSKHQFILS